MYVRKEDFQTKCIYIYTCMFMNIYTSIHTERDICVYIQTKICKSK